MPRDVIVITWADGSKAYEALTKLRNSYAADDIYQAGVVERTADGRVLLQDGGSNTAGANTLGGSLIGSLIGILGGPLGVLLGFSSANRISRSFRRAGRSPPPPRADRGPDRCRRRPDPPRGNRTAAL